MQRHPMPAKKSPTSSSADPVSAYAREVVSGKRTAGPHVRAQCARHLADIKSGKARGLKFDKALALRAIEFFETVLHLNGG